MLSFASGIERKVLSFLWFLRSESVRGRKKKEEGR